MLKLLVSLEMQELSGSALNSSCLPQALSTVLLICLWVLIIAFPKKLCLRKILLLNVILQQAPSHSA